MAAYRDKRRPARPWVLDISYIDRRTGKRKRYFRNAKLQTAEGARSEERMLLVTLTEKGFIPEPSDLVGSGEQEEKELTLNEAHELYVKTMKPTLKPSTVIGYEKNLKAHLLPRFGNWRLSAIDRAAMLAFDQELTRSGLSPSTRNNIVMPLRTIVWNAIELGKHQGKPDFPKLSKVQSKVFEPPEPEHVEAIVTAADRYTRVALGLAAYAGERAGEVIAHRWVNVNLQTGLLFVREGMTHGIVVTPKSGHQRTIPIAQPLQAILEEAKRQSASEYVAPSSLGRPWTHGGLRTAFDRALERAKLPHARLHDLRHFFITQCFVGGAGGPTVQRLAGHCHLSVTQRYAHTNELLMRQAIQVFGRADR
ncbi:MAG: tyrosine-type recombinase/integrase [Polyangiaceae bacterium]